MDENYKSMKLENILMKYKGTSNEINYDFVVFAFHTKLHIHSWMECGFDLPI